MKPEERNSPEQHPDETVDQLEASALDTEAPESKDLVARTEESDDSTEPAFDQDLDVEDLPGAPGRGSNSATEPSG